MCYLGELWHGAGCDGGWAGGGVGGKALRIMGLGGSGYLELVVISLRLKLPLMLQLIEIALQATSFT